MDYGIYPILPEGQKEERDAQIISLVNTFISKHQVNKERVSVSIPREEVIVRFIRFPLATKENLRKVVEYETSRYTPFEREETYFDYQILKEDKEWLHLFVVFVKKAEVDRYLSLLKKIGVQPVSIQIPSTAALNLFFYNEGAKEGEVSVLLDVADFFFEMNVIREGSLAESFHLPLPSEEKASRMIDTLKRSGLKGDAVSKSFFFVYGSGADDGTVAAIKETNGTKGASFPLLKRIEADKGISGLHKIYASIGVPLNGLVKTRMDLNLLPFEMRKKVRQIGKPLFIVLTSLALALSLSWGTAIFVRHRNELDLINAQIKKKRPEIEAIEKLQRQKEELAKEIAGFRKIEMGEVSKIALLKELTQILPNSVWIWNFKYYGKEVEITGFSDSASDLIPLIDKSPLFEKVEFLAPVTKERVTRQLPGKPVAESKEKERFKIKMRIETRKEG